MNNVYLNKEAKAWVKRKNAPDEIVRIVPHTAPNKAVTSYELYTAFEDTPDYLGRILFDTEGYWIYDGETMTIAEQEQLARFIINYVEII